MRALLVFNPNATTTDDRRPRRDRVGAGVGGRPRRAATKQRGHATHLVAGAVHEGVDAVFALGGDGTANEVLQALAGTDVRLGHHPGRRRQRPRAGARAAERRRRGHLGRCSSTSGPAATRRITLGRAGRALLRVQRRVRVRRRGGPPRRAARRIETPASPGRVRGLDDPTSGRSVDGREDAVGDGAHCPTAPATAPYLIAMIANTDPYTYLGPRADARPPAGVVRPRARPRRPPALYTPALLRVVGAGVPGRLPRRRRRGRRLPPRPRRRSR